MLIIIISFSVTWLVLILLWPHYKCVASSPSCLFKMTKASEYPGGGVSSKLLVMIWIEISPFIVSSIPILLSWIYPELVSVVTVPEIASFWILPTGPEIEQAHKHSVVDISLSWWTDEFSFIRVLSRMLLALILWHLVQFTIRVSEHPSIWAPNNSSYFGGSKDDTSTDSDWLSVLRMVVLTYRLWILFFKNSQQ